MDQIWSEISFRLPRIVRVIKAFPFDQIFTPFLAPRFPITMSQNTLNSIKLTIFLRGRIQSWQRFERTPTDKGLDQRDVKDIMNTPIRNRKLKLHSSRTDQLQNLEGANPTRLELLLPRLEGQIFCTEQNGITNLKRVRLPKLISI